MNTPIVRLEEITIKNLKNVEYGHIKLNVDKKCSSSNLLGLYGQNGSGKTVLINAIDILKQLLRLKIGANYNNKWNIDS